jgi:hypothetical protein
MQNLTNYSVPAINTNNVKSVYASSHYTAYAIHYPHTNTIDAYESLMDFLFEQTSLAMTFDSTGNFTFTPITPDIEQFVVSNLKHSFDITAITVNKQNVIVTSDNKDILYPLSEFSIIDKLAYAVVIY